MAAAFSISQAPVVEIPEATLSLPAPSLPSLDKGYLVYNFADHDEEMDAEITFSFFWDGDYSRPVLVSPTEGDINMWGFYLQENDIRPLSLDEMIKEFQIVCDKFIALVMPDLRGVIR